MKKRIGDILVEMGFIDRIQLEKAVSESKKTGVMLGDVLIRLDWISEEQLQMAIALQSGARMLDIGQVSIDTTLVSQIPESFARDHGVFPFELEENILKVATSNPFDVVTKDNLTRMTGNQIATFLAPKKWISKSIELYYKTAVSIDNDIDRIISAEAEEGADAENKTIRLGDLLLEKGYVLGASDIHFVPDINLVRVYYRVDGVLHQEYILPIKLHTGLVSRYKIMGNMDIANPNIPHDGRIKYQGSVEELDFRVSTFPTHMGETVVLRLLAHTSVVGELAGLGIEKEDRERFNQAIRRPYGLILVTGPTGSGKTTTLYSALMEINTPFNSIMTIEDPIEYVIPTIRQTAVNPKAGLTFGNALRSAMRQDPDIILVGEIRDQETAELALRASITGHLVLSTLHTNDAASAINRLLDLGVNSNILASSLNIVVAQRLMRKVCPQCFTTEPIDSKEREVFDKNGIEPPDQLSRPQGCESCYHTGYKGRIGIFEVLEVNREVEELIFKGALASQIEEVAVKCGTRSLFAGALRKAADQITSLEEVFRVAI
ncbi:MAG: GspE/PulE family protein [Thermodesulfobacteriota bacterium]|nr:GspE/PulE family protein [Thermodesulfobacteriota bacterium]